MTNHAFYNFTNDIAAGFYSEIIDEEDKVQEEHKQSFMPTVIDSNKLNKTPNIIDMIETLEFCDGMEVELVETMPSNDYTINFNSDSFYVDFKFKNTGIYTWPDTLMLYLLETNLEASNKNKRSSLVTSYYTKSALQVGNTQTFGVEIMNPGIEGNYEYTFCLVTEDGKRNNSSFNFTFNVLYNHHHHRHAYPRPIVPWGRYRPHQKPGFW